MKNESLVFDNWYTLGLRKSDRTETMIKATVKNILSSINVDELFNEKEKYEYELKKKTILIYTI